MKKLMLFTALTLCLVNLSAFAATTPIATTFPATSVTGSTAVFNARISANDSDTSVLFEYGPTVSYGSSIAVPGTVTGSVNTPVSVSVSGFSLNSTYHFRVKATNAFGTMYGDDVVFTTESCDLLKDGDFEGGTPSLVWTEASTNFGTPLCTVADCGNTGLAKSGSWWVWFGGVVGADESGSMTQNILIPSESMARLKFYLYIPAISGNGLDSFKVSVDGIDLLTVIANGSTYTSGYTPVDVDLSPFANNACHSLRFYSMTYNTPKFTNIFLDDASIEQCTSITRTDGVVRATLQESFNASPDGGLVSATGHTFVEDVQSGQSGTTYFNGGYDCTFSHVSSYTRLNGRLTVAAGKLIAENLRVY